MLAVTSFFPKGKEDTINNSELIDMAWSSTVTDL